MKLYGKIFLSFWLVVVAILGSASLLGRYLDDYRDTVAGPPAAIGSHGPREDGFRPVVPRMSGRIAVLLMELQHTPVPELPTLIKAQHGRHLQAIYVVDRQGRELAGQELPARVKNLLAGMPSEHRRARSRDETGIITAYRMRHEQAGPATVVLQFESPPGNPLTQRLSESPWLRIPLALLISGLACGWLSRVLTRRLRRVQLAAQRLAAGDLSAQIPVAATGGDETDQLARDFNRMATRLSAQLTAQQRLLHDVSHELRSPLARLRLALGLAERNIPGDEGSRQRIPLQRMETEIERLEQLISDLLSSESSAVTGSEDTVDAVALLRQLIEDANFEYTEKPVTATLSSALAAAPIRGSVDGLRKVFENVLRNAMQFSEAGSAVTVTTEQQDSQLVVRVTDRGPGVDDTLLEQIFQPFFRADSTRGPGGYGLGLNIAQRWVALLGGSIKAANRNDGPGLIVCIKLPLSNALFNTTTAES